MPYKTTKLKMPESLDRRIKLTVSQKQQISYLHHICGYGIRPLGRMYKVDRRTIDFTCYPDKLKQNKQRRQERGGWQQYYNKDDHAKSIKEHRRYKYSVLKDTL